MSSEISLSDSDEQDWDHVEELQVICPFCDQLLVGVHSAFQHSVLDHDFDFINAKEQLKLDEYGWFKLVNFTRSSLKSNPSFNMNDVLQDHSWLEGDKWLTPVLDNDPLLYALEELDLGLDQRQDQPKLSEMEQELMNATERAFMAEQQLKSVNEAFQLYQNMVRDTFLKEDKESFQENVHPSDEEQKDGYFTSYGELDIHEVMLKDKVRTCAYRDAIYDNKDYFKDKIVLDIGCGTGILSLFAAKAGAAKGNLFILKKVFAVDNSTIIKKAAQNAKLNNLNNVITFIPGKIEEISLPCEKVDIIISEWMGYFLLYEGMLNSVLFARDKWLSSDGLMAPSHVSLKITGFSDSEYMNDRLHYWKDVYGFNMDPMKSFVLQDAQVDWFNSSSCISKPITIKTFDTATVHPDELNFSSEFEIMPLSDGFLHGILGWFDTEFNCNSHDWKPISFSTSPFDTDTHWKQTLFVFSEPLCVKQGESKTGHISVQQLERDLEVKIKIDGVEFRFAVK
jgi:protein arginine N-methyltransferase 3